MSFFFSSRRRHTRYWRDWSSDVCSSDLTIGRDLVPELKVLYPSIASLSISHSVETRVDSMKADTLTLAVLKFNKRPSDTEKEKIGAWLKARLGAKKLRLIAE